MEQEGLGQVSSGIRQPVALEFGHTCGELKPLSTHGAEEVQGVPF